MPGDGFLYSLAAVGPLSPFDIILQQHFFFGSCIFDTNRCPLGLAILNCPVTADAQKAQLQRIGNVRQNVSIHSVEVVHTVNDMPEILLGTIQAIPFWIPSTVTV